MASHQSRRRRVEGVVLSNKMDKTVVVSVERREKHPVFGKFVRTSKRFHAHDQNNQCGVGDRVSIIETRPVSKLKRWAVVKVLEKAK